MKSYALFLVLLHFQFCHSVVFDSLRPHGLQHTRPPCPSPTPRVYSNSSPWSQWCHLAISSSVFPFFSRLQSFSASRSFPMSQLFTSGGQSTGISASTSVLPMKLEIMKNHSPFCNLFVVKCFWTFRKKKWGMLGVSNEGLGRFPTENVGCIILGKLDSIWYVKQNLEWFKQWAGWEGRIKWSEKF